MSEAVAVFVVVSCSNLAHMRFVVAGSCAVDCSNQTAPRRGRRGTLGERRRGRDWRGNGVGGGGGQSMLSGGARTRARVNEFFSTEQCERLFWSRGQDYDRGLRKRLQQQK